MTVKSKTEILQYGLHIYRSRHQKIRLLKRLHNPCLQGFRLWPSSWLLMDFFESMVLPKGTRVMEVGCGWGLAGIYCAKKYGAAVTGVDIDPEVFPYLRLHAESNNVSVTMLLKSFGELTSNHLNDIDVMIGADICFWDTMVNPLKELVGRALEVGVKLVLIADPGRSTFYKLREDLNNKKDMEIWNRAVQHPYCFQGKILKIGSINW